MMMQPDVEPPAPPLPPQTNHKAWAARLGAGGLSLLSAGIDRFLLGVNPDPLTVKEALIACASSLVVGYVSGELVYYVRNRPKFKE